MCVCVPHLSGWITQTQIFRFVRFSERIYECAVLERVITDNQIQFIWPSTLSFDWKGLYVNGKKCVSANARVFVVDAVVTVVVEALFSTPRISNCFTLTLVRDVWVCVKPFFPFQIRHTEKKIEKKTVTNLIFHTYSRIYERTHIECLFKWDRKKKQQQLRQRQRKQMNRIQKSTTNQPAIPAVDRAPHTQMHTHGRKTMRAL